MVVISALSSCSDYRYKQIWLIFLFLSHAQTIDISKYGSHLYHSYAQTVVIPEYG